MTSDEAETFVRSFEAAWAVRDGEAIRLADEVRVEWTDGSVSIWTNVPANQTLTLRPLDLLFGDGFESGDLSAWSSTVP